MSSSGITPTNSGPLTIRTYLGNSINNTYVLGEYDYPVSSNRVLITSSGGLVAPSDNIFISSINVSSINGGPVGPMDDVFWSLIGSTVINDNPGNVQITSNLVCSSLISVSTINGVPYLPGGGITAVVPGSNITVNSTNVSFPIVNLNSTVTISTLTTSTISSLSILDKNGATGALNQVIKADGSGFFTWQTDVGGGIVDAVVPGSNITVNSTTQSLPIVNLNSTVTVSTLTASTISSLYILDRTGGIGTNNQVLLTTGASGPRWSTLQTGTTLPSGAFVSDYLSWNSSAWVASANSNVYLGFNAGQTASVSGNAIGLGTQAGQSGQGFNSIALGVDAGQNTQGNDAVAIGRIAGQTTQGNDAVAVGQSAANSGQQPYAIAIGTQAAAINQVSSAISIGYLAGNYQQGENSIAIGKYAGYGQNGNSGGIYVQKSNSIILNASGTFETWTLLPSAFYVRPIRSDTTSATNYTLQYSTGTSEITYNTAKTFVINHPEDNDRYLVHACLEGPEDGIYYRGKAEITNNSSTIIQLPSYVNKLGTDFTIQITPIYNSGINTYATSEVEDGTFTVYGPNGKFFWLVNGKRSSFNIEPLKSSATLMGQGPYKWLQYT